uniref:Adenosine receptor B1a n=1 Tax=Eptatretus burgeri TaxID=7764 RepID=A0A8C4QIV4_EPTBU
MELSHEDKLSVPYTFGELFVGVLAIGGNALVCVAVLKTRSLKTVTNLFLVSLAIADVLVGLVVIPSNILTHIGLPKHHFIPCVLMVSSIVVFNLSSIFSLLAISVERYIAIFNPFRYQVLVTWRNALITIFFTWILSFIIGLIPAMGWNNGPTADGSCIFVLIIDLSFKVYFIFFGCVLVPLFIMIMIYLRIFMEVRRQLRALSSSRTMKKEMKTATSLFLVLFLFIVCWIPVQIMDSIFFFCPTCTLPLTFMSLAIILCHANSVVNPFLYALRMRSFRRAFIDILLCRSTGRSGSEQVQAVQ